MGMTIDTVTKWLGIIRANLKVFPEVGSDKKIESLDTAISYLKDLEMYQLDYNARLKADMVAVLEELKEQLREMHEDFFETEHFDEAYGVSDSMDIIQQKINALKGDDQG